MQQRSRAAAICSHTLQTDQQMKFLFAYGAGKYIRAEWQAIARESLPVQRRLLRSWLFQRRVRAESASLEGMFDSLDLATGQPLSLLERENMLHLPRTDIDLQAGIVAGWLTVSDCFEIIAHALRRRSIQRVST